MRILVIIPTLGTGGAERLAIWSAADLIRRGHAVAIAYGYSGSQVPLAEKLGVETIRITDARMFPRQLPVWRAGLRRAVREFEPEVAHAHSVTSALAIRLAAPRLPILTTVHGIDASDERETAAIMRLTGSRVIAVSETTAAGIARYRIAPPVEVLRSGVDVEAVRGAAAEQQVARHGSPAFCCVARHHQAKGVDVLIRAFPRVLEALPDAGLTLVGTGPEFEANAASIPELGLVDAIRVTGLVANAAPYMAAADVLVLPSRREGLPVAVLEGFALSRPFVATSVGGTPTVVRDGETGWLVAPDDEAALAAALVSAGSDVAEAGRRGAAGCELVEREWSARPMYDRIEAALRELSPEGQRLAMKPSAYYAAKHVVQRGRAARARRTGAADWQGLRVLAYHRVSSDRDELAIEPARFREHMHALRAADVEIVGLDDGLDRLDRGDSGRFVTVTFDDGYHDFADHAMPVLEALAIPSTVYVASRVVDGVAAFSWYRRQPPLLDWDDLRALARSGLVSIGAHTRTHPSLPQLDDARARDEIAGSRADVERQLGADVTTFAYPAGRYSPREVALVEEAGYRAGVTCEPGVNTSATPRAALCRTLVDRRDRTGDFAAKLAGLLDGGFAVRAVLHARRSA